MAPQRPLELILPAIPRDRSELPDTGPVLALDLGGTLTRAAVVLSDGTVAGRVSVPTPVADGADAIISAGLDALRQARRAAANERTGSTRPIGVAISAPGPLDPWSGTVVDPPNMGPSFRDIALGSRIEDALGLPCLVERDTNVAALGEAVYGAAQGSADFLYLTVSTGIGGAIVTGGRLVLGPDGMAGELGHITVDLEGEPCGCGGRGHLEAISSGTAIARAASQQGAAARSAREVARAAEEGDANAVAVMRRAVEAFASACVSLVDIFDPDLIVVGGGIASGLGDRLLGPARSLVSTTAFRRPRERVRIVPAALGDDVGLVGCLVLAASRGTDDRWRGDRAVPAGPRADAALPS